MSFRLVHVNYDKKSRRAYVKLRQLMILQLNCVVRIPPLERCCEACDGSSAQWHVVQLGHTNNVSLGRCCR